MGSPGDIEPGIVIEKCTGNIDLLPTLCDFAGIEFPDTLNGNPIEGKSMRQLLQNPANNDWVDEVYSEQKLPNCMIRSGNWKYVHYKDNDDRLYNLELDPLERINYISDPQYESIGMDLHQRLVSKFGLEVGIREELVTTPEKFRLSQNYPNPFNNSTRIDFYLPYTARVTLNVHNVLGQNVATLIDDVMGAGEHSLRFEGKNLPTGSYACHLQADGYSNTIWMYLTK